MRRLGNHNEIDNELPLKSIMVRSIIVIFFLIAIFLLLYVSDLPLPSAKKSSISHIRRASSETIIPTKLNIEDQQVTFNRFSKKDGPANFSNHITIHREEVILHYLSSWDEIETVHDVPVYFGDPLTASKGRIQGPSGEETWYNLDMTNVVNLMRQLGFDKELYPYWIRGDGVKMLGNYVMIAAELKSRPKGTILQTSLGLGIVCDTGAFAETNQMQIDIATNW